VVERRIRDHAVERAVGERQAPDVGVAGASWWSAARRIVLPAVAPGLAAGWLYVLALCVRELSSAIVVSAPGTELVATRIFADYENAEFGDLSALGLVVAAILAAATARAWRLGRRRLA
jgi:iron(III) transport system permease protein